MILTTLAISIAMNITPPAVHDTKDLDFRVPNFHNAPKFNLHRGLQGTNPVGEPRERRPRLADRNDDLLRLLNEEFGDKYTIIRWRGCIIVKPIKEDNSTIIREKRNNNRKGRGNNKGNNRGKKRNQQRP
jgi:hypothetical protein